MKQILKNVKKSYCHKLLATSIAAFCTSMIAISVTQASDIEIYQEAKSGDITLMFLLDLSGSMSRYTSSNNGYGCDMPSGVSDSGRNNATEARVSGGPSYRRQWCQGSNGVKYYDRITRVKDGMMDLLYGNPALNIQPLTNDKVIGLSTFSGSRGFIQVPARRLDAIVDGQTQRQILIETIGSLVASSTTPTARAYAEVGAYMLGTTTLGVAYSGALQLFAERQQWKTCRSWASDNVSCTDWRQGPTGSSTSWNSSSPTNPNPDDMTTFNCSVGGDTATCFREETTSTVTTNTIAYKQIAYAYRTSTGNAGGRRWKTCTDWATTGNPRACTAWSPGGTTGTGTSSWSATQPGGWSSSMVKTSCPSGMSNQAADCYIENVYQTIQQPINREYYARKSDWKTCNAWNSTTGNCSSWSSSWSSEQPANLLDMDTLSCNVSSAASTCYYSQGALQESNTASGFPYSVSISKHDTNADGVDDRYIMPTSISNQINNPEGQQCSGQGIYVLTDGEPSSDSESGGLMTLALGDKGHLFNCAAGNSGWDCVSEFTAALLDRGKNPVGLKYKTAVVGFGNSYNNLPSYNKSLSQAQNIQNLGTIDTNVKRAARWGILGEGGWYSGSYSHDVVNSVNDFISALSTEIPSVTTGSPTIPKDALNPAILQDDAYYPQFQPTPDKIYSLWVGNLKKYVVGNSGKLQGQNNKDVYDSRGRLVTPTYGEDGKLTSAVYDFWAYSIDSNTTIADGDENTKGSKRYAAKGGIWSQLKLMAGEDNKAQRKLYTNRTVTGSGDDIAFSGSDSTLKKVDLDYLTEANYKDDPDRGYLISLLGYQVDVTNPGSITTASLTSAPELRQIGAIMHSVPELVTNKGKVTYNATTKTIGSTNREDYLLFGTTQGLLHVVDAKTGQEKFAFVPNEMIENQKEGFNSYLNTSGGMENLYYGIDGPWAIHTEYVIDGSGNLTVGTGKGINQKGKQLAFGGLRMGGRSYYSLDLQDIDSPKLNFHINPDEETTGPLSYMGQSWSKPSVAYVNWKGSRKLVMFVGGGYDMGYEDPDYEQNNKKGAGVYMFSAEGTDAGELLWWASANAQTSEATTNSGVIGRNDENMKYSVVSQIRTVDRDGDDLVDHLYFGDLGGQLFRIDLDNKASKLGVFSKAPIRILDLNNEDHPEKSPRFYDMPSFSIYNEKGTTFAVVSVGSGNRSKPLQNYTAGTTGIVDDAIYNIYDKDVARKDLYNAASWNTKDIKSLALLSEENRYSDTTLVAPFTSNGWYYKFDNCVAGSDGKTDSCSSYKLQSEKVFGTPLAMNYRLYVSTFDSSKPGISGDCGAGVKGESLLTSFCLPFGQCASEDDASRGTPIGVGIQGITTGNDPECISGACNDDDDDDDGDENTTTKKKVLSSLNYCANTGGRIIITSAGGQSSREGTQMCLIPQRWYEKNSLIK